MPCLFLCPGNWRHRQVLWFPIAAKLHQARASAQLCWKLKVHCTQCLHFCYSKILMTILNYQKDLLLNGATGYYEKTKHRLLLILHKPNPWYLMPGLHNAAKHPLVRRQNHVLSYPFYESLLLPAGIHFFYWLQLLQSLQTSSGRAIEIHFYTSNHNPGAIPMRHQPWALSASAYYENDKRRYHLPLIYLQHLSSCNFL